MPPPAKTSKLVDRDHLLLLLPPVPVVHLPVTCKATQQHKQFPVLFFLDLPRPFLDMFHRRSFFGLRLRLLHFRCLAYDQRVTGLLALPSYCCCCRGGTERRLGRGQRGYRCVLPEEERNDCGAGLLCRWAAVFP